MNLILNTALEFARRGFHIFPLVANSKLPNIEGFPSKASTNLDQIKSWWSVNTTLNIGISTSNFGEHEALLVVDVDNKGDKKGDEEILRLEIEGFNFPKTFTQITPTGGRHLIYRVSQAVKQGTDVLGLGLDIRSRGGYIVGAGSTIEGKMYSFESASVPIAEAPKWMIDRCGIKRDEPKIEVDTSGIDLERAAARAKRYLETEAPIAVEGMSGDQVAFKVAARLKDFGLGIEAVFDSMSTHWNHRCVPPWAPDDLRRKVDHAFKYGSEPVGVAAPEVQFDAVLPFEPSEKPEENESYLQIMNRKYGLIFMDDGHVILEESIDEKGLPKRKYLNEQTFKRLFSPNTVQAAQKGRSLTWAEVWLDWSGRRQYNGLCFAPERETRNGYYNTWRGFKAEPMPYADGTRDQKAGFDAFIEHVRKNVCGGIEAHFNWIIGYFAQLIQKPCERPLTTVVFKGKKGVGKNAAIDRIGNLLGSDHYLVAHDSRYLVSNFNGHLESCLVLVLDEAFWSGDKKADGKLKGLTTSPTLLIERKGHEPYQADNLVRLIVLGNDDWLVPATNDERRYAVFAVGDGRMKDNKFFREMRVNLDEKGGNKILLHYLKNFDLKTVNLDVVPNTEALLDQKTASLEPLEQFWFESLREGRVISSDFSEGWIEEIEKVRFRDAFSRYSKERNIGSRIMSGQAIGRRLSQFVSVVKNQKRRSEKTILNVYRFPELHDARQDWEKFIGHAIDWDEG